MRDLAAGRLFTVGAARPGGTSRENVAVAVSATSTPDRSASRPLIRIVQEVPGGDRQVSQVHRGRAQRTLFGQCHHRLKAA